MMSSRATSVDSQTPLLLLFVAGDAPQSRRARAALREALEQLGRPQDSFREIDLLRDPDSITRYGIFATPALLRLGDGEAETLYGDLSDRDRLHRLLA